MMPSSAGVQSVEALFLLLLVFVASFATLARKLKIPYPIVCGDCRSDSRISAWYATN